MSEPTWLDSIDRDPLGLLKQVWTAATGQDSPDDDYGDYSVAQQMIEDALDRARRAVLRRAAEKVNEIIERYHIGSLQAAALMDALRAIEAEADAEG